MVLRLRITFAFVATALMAVVVSFVLGAMVAAPLLAALLAMTVSGGIAAVFGYVFGGATAQALADLNNVILRFIKWDMDGVVPHAARADEIGDIAKALKAFQADAIKWSESHKSEQDSQARLAAAHRRADSSVPRLDRRHSRRLRRQRAIHGRDGALALEAGQRHQ
jgi:methyl-accepting chemotaxis protein